MTSEFQPFDFTSKCPECEHTEARGTKNYIYCKKCKTRWRY